MCASGGEKGGKEKLSLNFALFKRKKKVVEGKGGKKKRVRENNEAFH